MWVGGGVENEFSDRFWREPSLGQAEQLSYMPVDTLLSIPISSYSAAPNQIADTGW